MLENTLIMRKLINKLLSKESIINLLFIGSFAIISLIYFYPLLSGKKIKQSDIDQFSGMSKQIVDHRDKYDEEPFWLDNAFLGMPSEINMRGPSSGGPMF